MGLLLLVSAEDDLYLVAEMDLKGEFNLIRCGQDFWLGKRLLGA
jgi:hypothetical protein